jgi:hypothetical protein
VVEFLSTASLVKQTEPFGDTELNRLSALASRPRTIEETGLSVNFVNELIAKHLYDGGTMVVRDLVQRSALSGPVVEQSLLRLRKEACVEVRGEESGALRYALTGAGRAFALESSMREGYLGPAPVPLEKYCKVLQAQSVHGHEVTREEMRETFKDIVIGPDLLDALGAAMHSGRAIFLYGPPGSGKTFMGQRLAKVFNDTVLIPYAIAIGDTAVQLYDPVIHQPVPGPDAKAQLALETGYDPRFVRCERPDVVTGGELTLDMLEVSYDPAKRLHQAPLQLKASNGIYMIDDLGRQRVSPTDLLNRWIVPLENKSDFMSLASGKRFPVPFDVVLIFSTNLNPIELADEAFLRRIGHKIAFGYLDEEKFTAIWRQVCAERNIEFDQDLLDFTLENLYRTANKPMLPCHPRDLLGMALDRSRYLGGEGRINAEALESAWRNYFVNLDVDPL